MRWHLQAILRAHSKQDTLQEVHCCSFTFWNHTCSARLELPSPRAFRSGEADSDRATLGLVTAVRFNAVKAILLSSVSKKSAGTNSFQCEWQRMQWLGSCFHNCSPCHCLCLNLQLWPQQSHASACPNACICQPGVDGASCVMTVPALTLMTATEATMPGGEKLVSNAMDVNAVAPRTFWDDDSVKVCSLIGDKDSAACNVIHSDEALANVIDCNRATLLPSASCRRMQTCCQVCHHSSCDSRFHSQPGT